jgi:hypothetical protein
MPTPTTPPPAAADELVERYVAWREACTQVRRASAGWGREWASDLRSAFAAYLAALDQEEQAARVYAEQVALVQRLAGAVTSSG